MRGAPRPDWSEVVGQVPGAGRIPSEEAEALVPAEGALRPWSSRAQALTAIQAGHGGTVGRKLGNVLVADQTRRLSLVRKRLHEVRTVVLVVAAILLTATGIALLYPSANDFDHGPSILVAGVTGAAGMVVHVVLERRSSPRALPYNPLLFLAYVAMGAVGFVLTAIELTDGGWWVDTGVRIGMGLWVVAIVGYVVEFVLVRRRPTLLEALSDPDTPEGADLDRQLRDQVVRVVAARSRLDRGQFRARCVAGVRAAFERGRIAPDDAVWMLREVVSADRDDVDD